MFRQEDFEIPERPPLEEAVSFLDPALLLHHNGPISEVEAVLDIASLVPPLGALRWGDLA